MHLGEKNRIYLQTSDLRTGELSVVPSSQGLVGAQWITQDNLVAANEDSTKLLTFDFKTQKWANLVAGNIVNWVMSPDRQYVYFATGGAEPAAQRLRFSNRDIETITS